VTRADYPARFGIPSGSEEAVKRRAQEMGREIWRLVERHAGLSGDPAAPFLLGTRFTLADLYLAVLSRWMGGRQWTPANCPKLEALAQAVAARPAIAPVWRKHRFAEA
jgi:GST-like protein